MMKTLRLSLRGLNLRGLSLRGLSLRGLSLPCLALMLAASACSTPGAPETELTQQQVCVAHNENDPAQRDRCMVNAASRDDTPPDVRPLDLPLRTGQIGD
jgi:hypothetical protein